MKTLLFLAVWMLHLPLIGQSKTQKDTTDRMTSGTFSEFKLRLLGPGLTSGRLTDIAIHPSQKSTWYIAVASGGVWKSTNAGISFQPIFDTQNSYSIGCVTIDPNNPYVVWVGSGENNSQRSVSYGDGVYKSMDGGKTWKNVGLQKSEHIAKIIVHPKNSNVVYAAAQGPLWGPGGDRGLYKTTNGGESWEQILKISENTGVTDVVMDPRDPDVMYAAAYQRRRHVWTLVNGGPEGAIHKTTDGGKTWVKLTEGLPSGDIGRIGLALPPSNPDIVYALIETPDGGGFYRSTNRGASWEKRSFYKSSSAQYYQELFCDPYNADRVYSAETYTKVTEDGGKTWTNLSLKYRHVDDHAIWIDPDNTDHILIGGDGGLYETYDRAQTFRHFDNLPVTQFYRVTVDNASPFYHVYGGTQDNNTWGAPTRSTNTGGITNEDWFMVIGGDGYKAQVDPIDPNIVYGEYQYGGLYRMDRRSGELLWIQPMPPQGEGDRWNWDTPILISPHSPTRLYAASQRLYQSDDRGHSWKIISPDLTRQIDRNKLPVMGKVQSVDAIAKNASTSLYGNIVSLSESPKKEGLIYVGTDDGLVQVTEDGGKTWRKIDKFPGVPDITYVSDLFASHHDENVVYATFDNHKNADFKPYVLRSADKGKTWTNISSNLPVNGAVYTIVDDHVNRNLLFCGTEFGLFFSPDLGKKWIQLKGDFPTIAVRDLDIQKREHDLAVGTFGRGIYIIDDYSPLRAISKDFLDNTAAHIFPIRDGLMYMPDYSRSKDDLGENLWRAKNPEFTITYYLKEAAKTRKQKRQDAEKEADKNKQTLVYPSYDELRVEDDEQAPFLIFNIMTADGQVIRRLTAPAKSGVQRISWDLKYPNTSPVNDKTEINKFSGMFVAPGTYKVTLDQSVDGVVTPLAGPVEFKLRALDNTTFPAKDRSAVVAFQQKVARFNQAVQGAVAALDQAKTQLGLIEKAMQTATGLDGSWFQRLRAAHAEHAAIQRVISGDKSFSKRNDNQNIPPSITDKLEYLMYGVSEITSDITQTQQNVYEQASAEFTPALARLKKMIGTDIKAIEDELQRLGAPYTPGRVPEWQRE